MESCLICNNKAKFVCTRCKKAQYCSITCQTSNWKSHRLVCCKFSMLITTFNGWFDRVDKLKIALDNKETLLEEYNIAMIFSDELTKKHPQAKKCYILGFNIPLPLPTILPYTLMFSLPDAQVYIVPVRHYNNLTINNTYSYQIGVNVV